VISTVENLQLSVGIQSEIFFFKL